MEISNRILLPITSDNNITVQSNSAIVLQCMRLQSTQQDPHDLLHLIIIFETMGFTLSARTHVASTKNEADRAEVCLLEKLSARTPCIFYRERASTESRAGIVETYVLEKLDARTLDNFYEERSRQSQGLPSKASSPVSMINPLRRNGEMGLISGGSVTLPGARHRLLGVGS
ncbi:hypothetical protein ACLOJK_022088 [Asimina triloba]